MSIFFWSLVVFLHLVPPFLSYLMGIYNAGQESRADYPARSWVWKRLQLEPWKRVQLEPSYDVLAQYAAASDFRQEIIDHGTATRGGVSFNLKDLWYYGGNAFYPSPGGWPFNNENDFWHRMKSFWIYLLSLLGFSCLALGLYWALLLVVFGSTLFVWIDFALIIILVGMSHYFQGNAFETYYNTKLDSKYSTYTKLTDFVIKTFLDDYKYPTFSTPQQRVNSF